MSPATAETEAPDFPAPYLALTCDRGGCRSYFDPPGYTTFAERREAAYADGWLFDGPWAFCPGCAPSWHLDDPSALVEQISQHLRGVEPEHVPDVAAQVFLVHEEQTTGLWQCPQCTQVFPRYTLDHPPCNAIHEPPMTPAELGEAAGELAEKLRDLCPPARGEHGYDGTPGFPLEEKPFAPRSEDEEPASVPGSDPTPLSGPGAPGPRQDDEALDEHDGEVPS